MTEEFAEWDVRLSSAAEADLREIGAWTIGHFGSRQAETYAAIIAEALDSLRAGPKALGVNDRSDVAPHFQSLHIGRGKRRARHVLIFRADRLHHVVDVVRILHDSMDIARHIGGEHESQ